MINIIYSNIVNTVQLTCIKHSPTYKHTHNTIINIVIIYPNIL